MKPPKIPAWVRNPKGAVQKKMAQEWIKKNIKSNPKALANEGLIQTLPEVNVYGSTDNRTDWFLENLPEKHKELWYNLGAPKIRQEDDVRAWYSNEDKTMGVETFDPNIDKLKKQRKEYKDRKLKEHEFYKSELKKPNISPKRREIMEYFIQEDLNSHWIKDDYIDSPAPFKGSKTESDFVAELSHAKQYQDSPNISPIRSWIGRTFYEDSSDPHEGRYGVHGQFEHEAHSVIEPQLWDELKEPIERKSYVIDMKKDKKKYSIGGTIGSVAGTAVGGPVGGAIGGGLGSLAEGLLFKSPEQKAAEQQAQLLEEAKQEAIQKQLEQRTIELSNPYGEGKRMYQVGGKVKPISDDAVEVQANDPTQTDSVDMGNFMVDNDEVIKKTPDGLDIYSDDLLVPGTKKSFAETAKELEKEKKMTKGKEGLIEKAMKDLFQKQQAINGNNEGSEEFKMGGKKKYNIGGNPFSNPYAPKSKYGFSTQLGNFSDLSNPTSGVDVNTISYNTTGDKRKAANSNSGSTDEIVVPHVNVTPKGLTPINNVDVGIPTNKNKTFLLGDERDTYSNLLVGKNRNLITGHNPNPSLTTRIKDGLGANSSNGEIGNLGQAAIQAAAFIPNIANAFTKLPEIPKPMQQSSVELQEVSLAEEQDRILESQAAANQAIRDTAITPGAATNAIAGTKASTNKSIMDLAREEERMNQSIKNQERGINARIDASNNSLINQYMGDTIERELADKRMRSENYASIANKVMAMGAEASLKELDKKKLQLIAQKYEGTGVLERTLDKMQAQGMSSAEMVKEILNLG